MQCIHLFLYCGFVLSISFQFLRSCPPDTFRIWRVHQFKTLKLKQTRFSTGIWQNRTKEDQAHTQNIHMRSWKRRRCPRPPRCWGRFWRRAPPRPTGGGRGRLTSTSARTRRIPPLTRLAEGKTRSRSVESQTQSDVMWCMNVLIILGCNRYYEFMTE